MLTRYSIVAFGCIVLIAAGCNSNKSPSARSAIQKSLDQAGLKQVSVAEDRQKGVITLSGKVLNDDAKAQAGSLAQGLAAGEVVANEIAVLPANAGDTKTLYADLDKGIQSNLDAALIQNRIPGDIHHTSNNGVVTLSGTVDSESSRAQAEQVVSAVPNVQQVVNELQIKDQKATSTSK
jgi:osmotically-inducible protein OsmY